MALPRKFYNVNHIGKVAQFPYEMARPCVENAFELLEGRSIPTKIDAPIKLLLKADIQ